LHRISIQRVWRGLSKMPARRTTFWSIVSSWASMGCLHNVFVDGGNVNTK
jgi:hypothetical protein